MKALSSTGSITSMVEAFLTQPSTLRTLMMTQQGTRLKILFVKKLRNSQIMLETQSTMSSKTSRCLKHSFPLNSWTFITLQRKRIIA